MVPAGTHRPHDLFAVGVILALIAVAGLAGYVWAAGPARGAAVPRRALNVMPADR
jgi:hypothetical protein